ncbi:MAG TPA: ribonuclease H family protein [Saprospiraceae bacterium]|nr:ribonuclease H family protein [Saprospiraceae bacterium]HMP14248.1 ribonuclease H family protein [Saprospiraceae bacterium]
MSKKQKYYVVWQGLEPGIYESWQACQAQIKGYPGAKYKAFDSRYEAETAFAGNYTDVITTKKSTSAAPNLEDVIWDSIAVDAACSGNPGVMEYRGVDTRSGAQLFYQKFELGTNNIGEFLALVHALAMFQKTGEATPIYTDSRNAMKWIRDKRCKTTLLRNVRTERLYQVIERAEKWLHVHTFPNKILKWDTERWGEIPADFGRK